MRRRALTVSIIAGLAVIALASPAVASGDCDLTVEASRSEPGGVWAVTGGDPAVVAVRVDGDVVSWVLTGEGYEVVWAASETFPATPATGEDGTVIDVGSAVTIVEGSAEGSIEGAARVTLCIANPSQVAGIAITSDTLPTTGITQFAPYVTGATAVLAAGAALSVAALIVGRRMVAG